MDPEAIVIGATGIFIFTELLSYSIVIPQIPGYIFLIVLATVFIQAGLVPSTAQLCGVCLLEPKRNQ